MQAVTSYEKGVDLFESWLNDRVDAVVAGYRKYAKLEYIGLQEDEVERREEGVN